MPKIGEIFFFMMIVLMNGCCNDLYIAPVSVSILKDDRPLSKQNIFPTFFYIDENGKENLLHYEGGDSATYLINKSSELERISFKPCDIYIRYSGLPETDTLEILLDYACDQRDKCSCNDIVLKYLKYNGVLLKDDLIKK